MKNSNLMFDRRIVDRNVTKGLLSEAEYTAYLEALVDCEANAERVTVGVEEAEAPESEG